MQERWLEIRLKTPDSAVDLVSQSLLELGCTGITAAEKTLDTFITPDPDSLANEPVLRAYFHYPEDLNNLLQSIRETLAELASLDPSLLNPVLEHRELADHDWESDWKQHFPPFRVGDRLVIHPSWVVWPKSGNEVVLTLDPGQAFGTGTHATTSLCLNALAEHFASSPPKKILDVGTGSGILAMAGAALGAEQVMACDIDSAACLVATENVRQNHLADRVTITDKPLQQIAGQFDLVLANILATENIRLAGEFIVRMRTGARLVLSGILIEQEQEVLDHFSDLGLALLSTNHQDEWTCIVYLKP